MQDLKQRGKQVQAEATVYAKADCQTLSRKTAWIIAWDADNI